MAERVTITETIHHGGYQHIKDPLALNGCEYNSSHIDTALRRIVASL